MSAHLLIHFNAQAEHYPALLQLLTEASQTLPGQGGCAHFQLFRSLEHPHALTVLEQWQSREDHAAHFARLEASGGWAHVQSLLAAAPQVHWLQVA
ncbi:putative quinol monooxygenase [Leeia aquatica]|uniref:ABM domain-containing protein n=1 Tax=Leeia aquatica TaxID=2725557 RepID=A0A847SFG0_9NEIS|nr:antibiotic biosynthesis monooxygenase family protein [Leeia aquatica]NLR76166.1 hypothetical protein [Leeia aquatica]